MITMRRLLPGALALAVLTPGCTLQAPEAPPLTGPSTLALSLAVAATPDILPEDGVSQSVIRITARDERGQPRPNVQLRVDTVVGSTIVDFGTLSARNVTTNGNGQAVLTFTAPRAPLKGVDTGTVVAISVRPVGGDFFGTGFSTAVFIRLVPESVALIPGAPEPNFFWSPTNPAAGQQVQFDASSSVDHDGVIVLYRWNYGDGDVETSTGPKEQHDFLAPGTYLVTLTVTDNDGKSSSITKAVTVGGT